MKYINTISKTHFCPLAPTLTPPWNEALHAGGPIEGGEEVTAGQPLGQPRLREVGEKLEGIAKQDGLNVGDELHPRHAGHNLRLQLDGGDVGDGQTVEQVDQDQHDEEDVEDKDDAAHVGRGKLDALELQLAGEAHHDRLHQRGGGVGKVGIHRLLFLGPWGRWLVCRRWRWRRLVKNDKKAEAEGDDKEGEPGQEAEKVPADLAEHGDVGGEAGMPSDQQHKLGPAEQDDDAGNVTQHSVVFVVIGVVGGEEEEDEGEEEEADLPDVLQAEDVPAKGDGHLEELPESEGHQANKCDPFDDGGGRSRARRIVGRAWNKNLSIKNNPFELHVMLNKSKSK